MLPRSTSILAVAALSILPAAAVATDRYYLDSSAISPSGRFRIDAKSPDNAGPNRRPFAANFTYTLTDTTTGKVLWQRKQPMTREKGSAYSYPAEGSPMRVFVNDDGLVTAYLAHETLLLLDPKQGRKVAEADILEAFPKAQQTQFVSRTTAGPMWTQDSDWFFLSSTAPAASGAAADKPGNYFVIRPYWNHRLIIDATSGKHIDLGDFHAVAREADLAAAPADVRRLLTAVLEEERRRAFAALDAPPQTLESDKDYRARWRLSTALHTVCFLKIADAAPRLRTLETSLDNTRDPYFDLRPKLRQALRAIGQVPSPGFGVPLYPRVDKGLYSAHDTDRPYNTTVPLEARAAGAPKVVAGISVKELTDLLGCPDAALYDGDHCYDYDIDAPAPYTLRIHLDPAGEFVKSVRTITPFAFLHDAARIRGY